MITNAIVYRTDVVTPVGDPRPPTSTTVLGVALTPADVPATATVSEPRPFRGGRVTVTGSDFAPGEQVTLTLGSRQLGSGTADDTGTVRVTARVPVLLPAGEQQLTLTGTSRETATTSITLRTLLGEVIDRLRRLVGG